MPNMSELIVDFPNHYETAEKSVQFSLECKVISFLCYDEDEGNEIWYKSRDFREMRVDTRWAVIEVNHRLRSLDHHVDDNHEDILDETVGIEHLLKSSIIRASRLRRAECIRAVLEEQARQRTRASHCSDICDEELLR